MSYTVSLKDLILLARQRANVQGAEAQFPDTEITALVNTSIAKWYDLVVMGTYGGQRYRASYVFNTNITTIASPIPYPLPPDFYRLISVDIAIAQNTVISARPFQEEQRNYYRGIYPIMGWLYTTNIYYQLWANNIVFTPGPQAVIPVTINYMPVAPRLFRPTDSIDVINSWEEYIVLDTAIKILIKCGQADMVQVLSSRLMEEEARIKANAPQRDMGAAEQVHMVDNSFDLYW